MSRVRLVVFLLLLCPLATSPRVAASSGPPGQPAALTLSDVLAWKHIDTPVVSNDGRWLAYRLSPTQGDSEIVVRETHGDREFRFGCGEVSGGSNAGAPGAAEATLAFSDDGKWVAFLVAPTRKDAAQLKKQHKPAQNALALVDLSTGKDVRIEKVRRFAFSRVSGSWLALQRYPRETANEATPPAESRPAGAAGAARDAERPKGADLVLRQLATGNELNVGNVADFTFDRTGTWIAWTVSAQDEVGNGVVARNLATGAVLSLDSGRASYERPTWTEKGDALAVLKGIEDRSFEDRLYSLVGFTGLGSGTVARIVYDPAADKAFPAGHSISPDRNPSWTEDLGAIVFGIRTVKKASRPDAAADGKPGSGNERRAGERENGAKAEPDPEEKPDLVIWHYKDRRLQSQQQVEEERDRHFSFAALYRPKDHAFVRLADEKLREVEVTPRSRWGIGIDVSPYELMAGMDGREYRDVYVVDLVTGARTLAIRKAREVVMASPDASRILYNEDGHFLVYDAATQKAANLTSGLPTSFVDDRDDHNVAKPPVRPFGWAADGRSVLLSDGWDVWRVPVSGGGAVNLTVNGRKQQIRYHRRFVLDPDEKGIDLGQPLYVAALGDRTKKGGIARIDPGTPGAHALLWDDAQFNRLLKARDADVFVYSRETFKEPADLHAAGAALDKGRKLTALDSQMTGVRWSAGSMLVEYSPDEKTLKGRKLQGALYLPADYQKGRSYPTIVYIYERLSDDYNRFFVPTANGFNKSVYTSNGYAVLMPDITYKLNDPGRSAVWCVLPAIKAAVATGVVDPARIGLQGHSWGGYQTAFLVTQTGTFKAAVAGAPLTDMVSMYSLIYKNSGRTNQAIFESSQGRFLGGYWGNWEAYHRNSPVFFAQNVRTPLVILHNDKDGAVDFTQGVEYFNTLRRLGKPVWMLEYPGENHGLRKPANMQDYTVRMREFFDHYLQGAPAPDWLTSGVPLLDMKDHLEGRAEPKKETRVPQGTEGSGK